MRRGHPVFLLLPVLLLLPFAGCSGVSKLDWKLGRDGWQRPRDVVRALAVVPGDRVADLGAGEGYFLSYLSEAVGSEGRVFAVEVESELTTALEEGFDDVEVVLGDADDPKLPDGGIDLVVIVNTYHHIEDRPAYFARLKRDLRPAGRVAILEPNAELTGLLTLFQHEGHWSADADVVAEMASAGYRPVARFDFLPTQIFVVFTPLPEG